VKDCTDAIDIHHHMPALLVHLDDATIRALEKIAAKRKRSEFIRSAIKRAIRDAEYERMRRAYAERPDSETEADEWPNAEEHR
jgi:predicted transcriptional regulator